jgi:glutaredoxin
MSKTHKITHNDGITKIKFLVSPSYGQVKSIIDEVSEKYPYEKRLWDLSEIKFDFSTIEIKMISDYGKQKFTKANKLAIYVVDDLAFGEMRQFEVYREEEKSLPGIFRNEQEAIEWLNS